MTRDSAPDADEFRATHLDDPDIPPGMFEAMTRPIQVSPTNEERRLERFIPGDE